ncbi:MAG TPA: DoxX family protein [Pyrinomonadaceae bacterium]|jgi:putative oxidoreductase|nr:DoxX family protein [Pyrinomonadaceae bacterium]
MADQNSLLAKWTPRLLSILRIVVALLFIEHGTQKLFNVPSGPPGMFPVPALSLFGIAAVLEMVGGLFILLGLFTRPAAFILAGEMAVGYFMMHAPNGFWPIMSGGNGGELAVLFCFVFLYVAVAGGGSWSLDRQLRRER